MGLSLGLYPKVNKWLKKLQERLTMRLPSKDSATASAVRVLIYTILPLLVAFVGNPQAVKAIVDFYPPLAPIIVAGTPILCFIYNYTRKDIKNY